MDSLAETSILGSATSLKEESTLGAAINLNADININQDMVIKAGSILTTSTVLKAGTVIGSRLHLLPLRLGYLRSMAADGAPLQAQHALWICRQVLN